MAQSFELKIVGQPVVVAEQISDGRAFSVSANAASIGIADARINRGQSFLVFIVKDGNRIVEVNFLGVCHTLTVPDWQPGASCKLRVILGN
jgi:hypothetical protein